MIGAESEIACFYVCENLQRKEQASVRYILRVYIEYKEKSGGRAMGRRSASGQVLMINNIASTWAPRKFSHTRRRLNILHK